VTPTEQYAQRLVERQARVAEFEKVYIRIGNLRLAIAAVAAVMVWLAWSKHLFSPWWVIVPLGSFAALASYHSRVLRARTLAERAVGVYQRGLARIADKWGGTGPNGERFSDPHHVYAADLDLFGSGGLFELLSSARTRMGEDTLASWLMAPACLQEIRERQAAVTELRDKLDLREQLAVLGEDAATGVHPKALLKWSEAPNLLPEKLKLPARMLAAAAIVTGIVWAQWDRMLPFVLVVGVESIIAYWVRHRLDEVLHGTEHAFEDLALLAETLARVEDEEFSSPKLKHVAEELRSHELRGSEAIRRLQKIVDLSMSRDNFFLRMLDVPLMYSVQVAFAAERWRLMHGHSVKRWLTALGQVEALLSISAYCFEHPDDCFPEFREGRAMLEAVEIGHPLLPDGGCVRNDVRLTLPTRALLVSGSNMSGKSTLLRGVGINVVMAMAGAPVRASRLRMTPLQVGASIRVNDSLQEGSSRFYAEISRLRLIVDMSGQQIPIMFLLDELLQGTNSRDRRIGAEGILRGLINKGGIGLVSTHDLALTEIGVELGDQIENVHFEDELKAGKISFDYKLRPGVVTKSNGLELMRSIGLDV
jgi:MutS domain V